MWEGGRVVAVDRGKREKRMRIVWITPGGFCPSHLNFPVIIFTYASCLLGYTCIEQGVSSTNLKHATRSLYLVEQKWFEFGEASSQVVDLALASSVAHDACEGIVGRTGTNGREKNSNR